MIFGHVRDALAPYAEGILSTAEAARVARHLLGCRRCRRSLERVRAGVRLGRALRPATTAVPVSWAELAPGLGSQQPTVRPANSRGQAAWAVAAAAVLLLVAAGPLLRRPGASTSVPRHETVAPEVQEMDPVRLRAWIAERTGLAVALSPAAGVRLEGAARVPGGVAVTCRVDGTPATLLIGPAAGTPQRLDRRLEDGSETIRWSHRGQLYALISDAPGIGDRGCALCHANAGPVLARRLL